MFFTRERGNIAVNEAADASEGGPGRLSDVPEGEWVFISRVHAGQGLKGHLSALGLIPNTRCRVVRNTGRGPLIVHAHGSSLMLGRGMAEMVEVAPESCPAHERMTDNAPLTLAELVTGDRARIVRVRGGGPAGIRQRLLDMGITRGTEIRVQRHAPLGDPVELTVKGYYLALRMSEARQVDVERIE
jgi:ferrous iron transport protein A